MPRRKLPETTDNHERWLISYADFITLLFAFFVVMYSTSAVNYGDFRVLSDSIVAAFTNPRASLDPIQEGVLVRTPVDMVTTVDSVAERPVTVPLRLPEAQSAEGAAAGSAGPVARSGDGALERVAEEAQERLQDFAAADQLRVRRESDWVEIEISDELLFPAGSRALLNTAVPLLAELAVMLRAMPNTVNVEGFTDNQPIRNGLFPSNWELSAARAAAVVRALEREGVASRRLSATGYGEHRPISENDTEEGRAKNRRVVLVVRSYTAPPAGGTEGGDG
jgi:chemotaxis protein MotB